MKEQAQVLQNGQKLRNYEKLRVLQIERKAVQYGSNPLRNTIDNAVKLFLQWLRFSLEFTQCAAIFLQEKSPKISELRDSEIVIPLVLTWRIFYLKSVLF